MESGGPVRTVDCAALYTDGRGPTDWMVAGGAAVDFDEAVDPIALQHVAALYDGEVHELALHLWTLIGFFAFETKSEAPSTTRWWRCAELEGSSSSVPGLRGVPKACPSTPA